MASGTRQWTPRACSGHRWTSAMSLCPEAIWPTGSGSRPTMCSCRRPRGWAGELSYYDPPAKQGARPKQVGRYPCAVFGTVSPDGRQHAHRIHVEAEGAGKADLGVGPDGRPRDAKKAARLKPGQSAAGCAVLWGDPASAPHLLLAEGIETAGALALAHRAEVEAGELAVAAALSTSGIRAFVPWPATRRITIAADRDEDRPSDDRGFKAGEKTARSFAH